MIVSIIAAIGRQNQLGLGHTLPWHVPEDFQHFKKTTMGHFILMGRKSFEALKSPLPGRTSIVITRQKNYPVPTGVLKAADLEESLNIAKDRGEQEAFITGGGEIYKLALERGLVDRMYLSYIDYSGPADVFFPKFDERQWKFTMPLEVPQKGSTPSWCLKVWEKKA